MAMKKEKAIREGNKRHIKYFQGGDDLRLAGIILMVASGVLFIWTWYMMWSYILYLLMLALLPVGFVLFLLGSVGRSDEGDIDGVIEHLTADIMPDKEKDASIVRRQRRLPQPEIVSGYDYSDGLMFRKTKSGLVRSEMFRKTVLIPLDESIYITQVSVNIPSEKAEKTVLEIPYTDIEDMVMTSERRVIRYGKKSFSVKDDHLEIISQGKAVISLPVKESATLDSFIKEIKQLTSK